jgi:hypothetical protein
MRLTMKGCNVGLTKSWYDAWPVGVASLSPMLEAAVVWLT